jgi:hypothetical protein
VSVSEEYGRDRRHEVLLKVKGSCSLSWLSVAHQFLSLTPRGRAFVLSVVGDISVDTELHVVTLLS